MADLTPDQLDRISSAQLDPTGDLALVWDASAGVLKTLAAGALVGTAGGGWVDAVRDAGVDNTGVNPASDALNAVLDDVELAGGGIVFLQPGVYRNDTLVRVGDNTTLLGSGRGATILRGDAAVTGFAGAYGSVGCIGKTRATIRSLTVDLATNGCRTNGIGLWPSDPASATGTPSSFCSVVDCEVLGFDSHQYLIWNRHSDDSTIAFNSLDGGVLAYTPGSLQEGIEIFGGRRVSVIGNRVANVGNSGIFPSIADDYADHSNTDVLIALNTVVHCGRGIAAGAVYGPINGAQILDRVQIRGNSVLDCWVSGILLYYGGVGEPPGTVVMRDVVVDGNTVVCGATANRPVVFAFDVQTANATTTGCVVTNNVFRGGRPPTGGAVQASRAHGSAWRGNRILDADATAHCVSVVDTDSILFEGNDLQGAGMSALALVDVRNAVFRGNHVADWNRSGVGHNAIALYRVVDTTLTGNTFDCAGVGDVLCLQGSDAECAGLAVSGNVVQRLLGSLPELVRSPGPDGVRGELEIPDGAAAVALPNARIRPLTPVHVTQLAGVPSPFVAERGLGTLTIRRDTTAGVARYGWHVAE